MTIHEPSMPPRSLPRLSGFPFSFFLFLAFEIAASRAALWSMAKEFGEAPGLTPITGITYDIVALGLLGAVRLLLES